LPFIFLSSDMNPGSSNELHSWNKWKGLCITRRRLLVDGAGIFCGNYASKRGHWTPCQQAWCGPYYIALDKNEFPVAKPTDEDGVVLDDPLELNRYLCGRNGDNLITPFQCDICHFRNLTGKNPDMTAPKDHVLMRTIRRAQLDAFWATEPSTVSRNLGELNKGAIIANTLGFQQKLFRPMEPFPLEDTFGMGPE